MPSTPSTELHRSHLLARLPTRGVPAFVKKLLASGVNFDCSLFNETTVMNASAKDQSLVMAWVVGTVAQFERWRRDPAVLSLGAGEAFTLSVTPARKLTVLPAKKAAARGRSATGKKPSSN